LTHPVDGKELLVVLQHHQVVGRDTAIGGEDFAEVAGVALGGLGVERFADLGIDGEHDQ